jgi:riboflavin kinase / FMN adenylyltransferase
VNPGVFFSLEEARGQFGPCALSIGNFDGVHVGHQALLAVAQRYASNLRVSPAVLTFHPHPAVFVAPHRVPEMICGLEERLRRLRAAGAERILVLPFNHEVARLGADEFVSKIVVGGLEAKAVFVGENFRFGYQRAGGPQTLEDLGERYGFTAHFIKPVKFRGRVVSSSLIRQNLAEGKVSAAGRMLGRCFSLEGAIVSGQGVGAKQTVPTLNLRAIPGQLTPRGVYVTETFETSTGRNWPSITNVGSRPTFGGGELTIETFLLTPFDGNMPEYIQIHFRFYLRAERKFPSADELKAQIMKDVARAKSYWRRVPSLY